MFNRGHESDRGTFHVLFHHRRFHRPAAAGDSATEVRGSGDWRLDPGRARQAEFLVCTRNQNSSDFAATPEPHRSAFLIGRISGVVPSDGRPSRWTIKISEFLLCDIPNIWAKSGHLRYPVWYTTLEELGIDLGALPPFQPVPDPGGIDGRPAGMADAAGTLLVPPRPWTPARHPGRDSAAAQRPAPPRPEFDHPAAWTRLDAILAQLDRVPDLPRPFDPLEWDEHGLPR